jgi:hypothetical protein
VQQKQTQDGAQQVARQAKFVQEIHRLMKELGITYVISKDQEFRMLTDKWQESSK